MAVIKNSNLASKQMMHLKSPMSHKIVKKQNKAIALLTDNNGVISTITLK